MTDNTDEPYDEFNPAFNEDNIAESILSATPFQYRKTGKMYTQQDLDNALKAQRITCMESIHKSAGLTEHELRHVTMLDKIREAILNARIEE